MSGHNTSPSLFHLLDILNGDEEKRLSPSATFSTEALRRKEEKRQGHRQNFALDADRILHSKAYTRYIDKTQVFWLVDNDHITHRVLHVQLVSRIARTIGRFLFLNEDLIEAIALGHDIGHPPFGHDGEKFLSDLCVENDLPPFQHNIQSVRSLDRLEKKGAGWNLSLQTLDGILCHDGESHSRFLIPNRRHGFVDLDQKIAAKENDPATDLNPMTLEGCVVRLADTVAYIGRDIEDAIILGLIKRTDIPADCREVLGDTNGSIVYTLVTDLIANSIVTPPQGKVASEDDSIGFSEDVAHALGKLKEFNYLRIYLNPLTKQSAPLIKECYKKLFYFYIQSLKNKTNLDLCRHIDLLPDTENSQQISQPEAMVRDYIAGMTDDFFLKQAAAIGCPIPKKQ
jgi:dGTPase